MALLIYSVFALYTTSTFSGLLPWDNQNYEAAFFAERIANQINGAHLAGEGYHNSFELPEQVRGREYTVHYSVEEKVVEIDIVDLGEVDSYGMASFIASDVYMDNIVNGTNYVSNTNGTIVVWRP